MSKISSAGIITILAGKGTLGEKEILVTNKELIFQIGYVDGQGTSATFGGPDGLVVDGLGNVIVCDSANDRIRLISPSGLVTTIAGGATTGSTNGLGLDARFNGPKGVAVDQRGNIYVSDSNNNIIRMIVPCDGGFFVQNATCQTCPGGTFSPFAQFGNSSCIPCGPGNFSAAGSAFCFTSCGPEYFTVVGSAACLPVVPTATLHSASSKAVVSSTIGFVSSGFSLQMLSSPLTLTALSDHDSGLPTQVVSATTLMDAPVSTVTFLSGVSSNSFDVKIVIYAFVALGGCVVVATALVLMYRRHKQQHLNGSTTSYQKAKIFGVNRYLGPPRSAFTPTAGPMYRQASGLETNLFQVPQLGQPVWNNGSFAPEGTLINKPFLNGTYAANPPLGVHPNVVNPTVFSRTQSQQGQTFAWVSAQSLNFLGNTQTTHNLLYPGMTTSRQTRIGNTPTLVPKNTIMFLTNN